MIKVATMILAGLSLLGSQGSQAYIVEGSRVHQPRLLSYAAENLPNQGVIERSEDGYTYLKVPQQYAALLVKHFPKFSSENSDGRICIIDPSEGKDLQLVQELGKTISFKPLGFFTVVENDKEYFRLAVDAPELSALRAKYGLSKQLDNQAFHLTIGVRKLAEQNELNP